MSLSRKLALLGVILVLLVASLALSGAINFQLTTTTTITTTNLAVPCTITTNGSAWEGELAFGVWQISSPQGYLIVMTTSGDQEYLRHSNDTSYLVVTDMGQGTLMFSGEPNLGGATGNLLQATHFWDYVRNATADFPDVFGHHDVEYDPVNNTFLTLQNYIRTVGSNLVLFDKIVELSVTGKVLWSWDSYNYIPLSEADPFNATATFPNGTTVIDFLHGNALDWDYNNGIVYFNSRHTNTFYKINQTDGSIIWACGEYGNFTLLDENGAKVKSLWYHSHATKRVQPGVFSMFDNDFANETNQNDCHSRMIEVTLNETSMTARVTWSWAAPKQYWTPYLGDVDRLPNGDRIGTFGSGTHQFPQNQPWNFNDTGAVLIEVDPAGNIVRTYTFPVGWNIYRIEELNLPTATPSPSPTPTPSPSPTPTATPTATPNPTPTPSPTPSPAPSPSPTPTATPTPTPSSSPGYPEVFNYAVFLAIGAVGGVAATLVYTRKKRTSSKTVSPSPNPEQ